MTSLNKRIRNKANLIFGSIFLTGVIAPLLLISQSAKAAACTTPSPSYGTDSISINVPSTSTYAIWTRLKAPVSTSNEILLQLDSSNCYTVGGSSGIPVNSWTWVDYQNGSTSSVIQLSISAGAHTLKYIGNETGVSIDRVELISGNSCTPQNAGDNCNPAPTTPAPAPTPPAVSGSSGSSSTSGSKTLTSTTSKSSTPTTQVVSSAGPVTVPVIQGNVVQSGSAPLTLEPSISSSSPISKVEYYLNSKLVYTATKSPYTYKVNTGNLTNGRYNLTAKTVYLSGKTVSQTETLVVKHNFWRDTWLIFKKYLLVIFVIIILLAAFVIWRRNYLTPAASTIEIDLPPETPTPPTAPVPPDDSDKPDDQPPASVPPSTDQPAGRDRTRFPW